MDETVIEDWVMPLDASVSGTLSNMRGWNEAGSEAGMRLIGGCFGGWNEAGSEAGTRLVRRLE